MMTTTLQMEEATAAFRVVKMPARVFSGTKVEAEFVVETLKRAGVASVRAPTRR